MLVRAVLYVKGPVLYWHSVQRAHTSWLSCPAQVKMHTSVCRCFVLRAQQQQAIFLNQCCHHAQVYQWSRVGRLKRAKFPSLKGGGHTFGGGAGAGALACTAGRLLCDTYLSARCAAHRAMGFQGLGLDLPKFQHTLCSTPCPECWDPSDC